MTFGGPCGHSRLDWSMHLYPPFTRKRRWRYPLDESVLAQELTIFQVFRLTDDFFPHKFAACWKPPSRDNHRKTFYSRTQQRDQGAGWTHDHAIRVVKKTTSLLSWPRCRHSIKPLPWCFCFLAYKFNKQWQWMSIWANISWIDSLNIVTKNLHN